MVESTDGLRPVPISPPDRETIHSVYLYHLARSGSPWEAEDFTAQTFEAASASIEAFNPQRTAFSTWVFRIARYLQAYGRPRSSRHRPRQGDRGPDRLDLDRDFPGDDQQAELRAITAEIAADLRQLPSRRADAFALRFLAGLSLAETAAVLDRDPAEVEQGLAADVERLRLQGLEDREDSPFSGAGGGGRIPTVSRLHPDEKLVEAIQRGWSSGPPRRGRLWSRLPGDAWAWLYRLRTGFTWSLRAAPVILVAAVLFFSLARGRPASPPPAPTPAGIPSTGKSLPGVAGGARRAGILGPPDPAFCEVWQGLITQVLGRPASLEQDAPYSDPVSNRADRSGRGCLIQAAGSGVEFVSTHQAVDQFAGLLDRAGFKRGDEYTCTCGIPGNDLFGQDWYGRQLHFLRDDLQATLSISWRPVEPGSCPTGQPEKSCPAAPDQQAFSLRLVLAKNRLKPFLDQYLAHWGKGEIQALNFLGEKLRARVADIPTLDAAAGVQHTAIADPTFSWQLSDTSSGRLRVRVIAYEWIEYSVPLLVAVPFHIELLPDGEAWKIENITPY